MSLRTPSGAMLSAVGSGTSAIAVSSPSNSRHAIHAVTANWNTAPTTSQSITVTLNSVEGAAYDTILRKEDPSVGSVVDYSFEWDNPLRVQLGSTIDVAYTNTDSRTVSVEIIYETY